MRPTNLLFICSDQHNRAMTGSYGHPLPVTPNLDALAARGTRFANAYTNCPICMPARASLATGRYVHQIQNWDNAHPYCGQTPSWHHRLREQGFRVDSIGKLHFRGGDDNGFSQEHFALHRRGKGDVPGCLREQMPARTLRIDFDAAGPGDSSYLRFDARNAEAACGWIGKRTGDGDKPWALFLGIGSPHQPFIAPPERFARYHPEEVPLPPRWRSRDWPRNPALDFLRQTMSLEEPFPEAVVRRANAAYLGLCAFVDDQVGRVLAALEESGQAGDTRVIYTSDHGESMGANGIVGKFTMYDESAAIPLLMAGPDVPEGHVVDTPVSLVDVFPTVLDAVGAEQTPDDEDLPGQSLWQIARQPDHERTILSEYHALATRHAVYMLRDRRHKYIHYHHDAPQLFAASDTDELSDLAAVSAHAGTVADFEARLGQILDPDAVDRAAKADQQRYFEANIESRKNWPPRTDGPPITYTTIPPDLDPGLADDPATREPGWKPTRDLPDDYDPAVGGAA